MREGRKRFKGSIPNARSGQSHREISVYDGDAGDIS